MFCMGAGITLYSNTGWLECSPTGKSSGGPGRQSDEHELAVCPFQTANHIWAVLTECSQQVKGCASLPSFGTCDTTAGVLLSDLGFPVQGTRPS